MKLVFTFLIFISVLCAQSRDTVVNKKSSSTLPDTLFSRSDTTAAKIKKKTYDVDTTIYANATDSLIFYVKNKRMDLFGEGELQYKTTLLKSANISVDFTTSNIEATGVPGDTVGKIKGTPVLNDNGEPYEGLRMKYNFKTMQGYITAAGSKMEGGIYTGEKIKKVDKDTYFIQDGIYTTCDEKPPHYYFYSHEMKVIQKEQIVAKWIWLFFGGVPFPVPLPFAVFPIESGRRSGILPPAFGSDATYGNYFSRFGYFWAINDYMDVNLTTDYYTRGSYNLNSRYRYVKKYLYSGNIEGGYSHFISGEPTDQDNSKNISWRLLVLHNQTIDPTTRFDVNLDFQSGSYAQRNVYNLNEKLTRTITSNANLFKSWEESGNSLSLNYQRLQNLDNGNINEIIPNLNFNMPQKYPFRKAGVSTDPKWYEQFGYNYSGQFQNRRNKTDGNLDIRGGFLHNLSASFSPKIGYFNFTPNINYQEKWYNKKIERLFIKSPSTGNDTLITRDVHQINEVRSFGMGVSAQTRFYGIFSPKIFGINSIRHTVNPSISYNFTPDFSKAGWGYYDTYVDTTGKIVKYNKFEREVFGGPSSGESQNISFALSNIFEMKTEVDPTDTTSKEKKFELIRLDAGFSYNFAADSLKLSDLNIGYRTQIGELLNLNGGFTFTPYDYAGKTRINKLLINEGKGLFRMTNFSFQLSTSISGEKLKSSDSKAKDENSKESDYMLQNGDRRGYRGIYQDREPDFTIPWDLSFSYNYNLSRPDPLQTFRSSNLNGSINFNLTPAWKFSLSGSYDFDRKEFAAPQIIISRDLHCWIMNFTWNPLGTYRGYRLEIKVKAPQLQDLKITKRSDFFSGAY